MKTFIIIIITKNGFIFTTTSLYCITVIYWSTKLYYFYVNSLINEDGI